MFKGLRYGLGGVGVLGLGVLLGCGAQRPGVTGAASGGTAPAPAFTLNTPVERIAADPRGRAVLERDVPGLMASSRYMMFEDMSLSQIATMSGGRLTQAKLELVRADLARIPQGGP